MLTERGLIFKGGPRGDLGGAGFGAQVAAAV